jgi:hypothetical protein
MLLQGRLGKHRESPRGGACHAQFQARKGGQAAQGRGLGRECCPALLVLVVLVLLVLSLGAQRLRLRWWKRGWAAVWQGQA